MIPSLCHVYTRLHPWREGEHHGEKAEDVARRGAPSVGARGSSKEVWSCYGFKFGLWQIIGSCGFGFGLIAPMLPPGGTTTYANHLNENY